MRWRRRPASCGHRCHVGWTCNRPAGHADDYHEFHDEGTGRGDDKTVRWVITGPGTERIL